MELDHEFTVPVPIDHAWAVLLDVERVAPCMPGATLDSIDGDEFTGRLKVKLGAMTITYKGAARIASKDEASHTVTMEGTGKESRGAGTASATVQAQLHDEGDTTRVTVHTKLNVTGRPAQFGRNILSEVGGKLIGRFADGLHEEIQRGQVGPEQAPAAGPEQPAPTSTQVSPATDGDHPTAPRTEGAAAKTAGAATTDGPGRTSPAHQRREQRPTADAIDLLEVAGPAVAKRAAPVAAGFIAVFTIWRVFRRRRGRHR
ncbi:MAG TPA: SRPBCC family protein [Streptosporangiaceae bacterium]|jgi:carbon monoxide dehydrogenase subunit G|nr:SRPBCC family protein [Streptosporangiaceae bacterium]